MSVIFESNQHDAMRRILLGPGQRLARFERSLSTWRLRLSLKEFGVLGHLR